MGGFGVLGHSLCQRHSRDDPRSEVNTNSAGGQPQNVRVAPRGGPREQGVLIPLSTASDHCISTCQVPGHGMRRPLVVAGVPAG